MPTPDDLPAEFHTRLAHITHETVATLTGPERDLWDRALWRVDGWEVTVAADDGHAYITAVDPDGTDVDVLRVALDSEGLPPKGRDAI